MGIGLGLGLILGIASESDALPPITTQPLENAIAPLPISHSATDLIPPSPHLLTSELPPEQLDLDPEIIEDSPVLQRWLEEVPDVQSDIRHDPSFRTRIRLGYSQFPSTDQAAGITIGIEDVFVGQTGLTVSADYQAAFDADREAYGADLRYYILPLGSYVNVAPVVGYRSVEGEDYNTNGMNIGVRLMLALSRTGAADISLTQSWVAPGSNEEVGITTLSMGYAITSHLRVAADLQKQNAPEEKDSRVAIVLEWML